MEGKERRKKGKWKERRKAKENNNNHQQLLVQSRIKAFPNFLRRFDVSVRHIAPAKAPISSLLQFLCLVAALLIWLSIGHQSAQGMTFASPFLIVSIVITSSSLYVSFLICEARLLPLHVTRGIFLYIYFVVISLPCHSANLLPANPCLTSSMFSPFNTGSVPCHAKCYPCLLSHYSATLHTTSLLIVNPYLSFIMLPFLLLALSILSLLHEI